MHQRGKEIKKKGELVGAPVNGNVASSAPLARTRLNGVGTANCNLSVAKVDRMKWADNLHRILMISTSTLSWTVSHQRAGFLTAKSRTPVFAPDGLGWPTHRKNFCILMISTLRLRIRTAAAELTVSQTEAFRLPELPRGYKMDRSFQFPFSTP